MIPDDEAIQLYDADMAFRNLLPGTRHVRARYLKFFSRDVGFADATEQKIIVWLSRDISSKTRNMYLSTLTAFYRWSQKGDNGKPVYPPNDDGSAFDPVSGISKPRMHPRQPRPIPSEELQLAVAHADARMKCWLLLASLAGLRCQEIAFIAREDIYEDTMRIRVTHGKGAKERWGVLHPDVLAALRELPMRETGPLWDETAASVSRKGNKFLHSLGIKPTMHTLRHYFGTAVYRQSKDLRLTQELMGHSSPSTTAIYAAPDQEQAAGVVTALHI